MKYIPTIFLMLILLTIWSCEDMGEPILEGCMTETACNYDADATLDDGSCTYAEENFDCDGECLVEVDVCGTCGGTIQELSDCCTESEPADCANVCGGSSVEDDCGVCDTNSLNDNTTCTQDCAGIWGGSAVLSGCDNACNSTAVVDCVGVCGGSAILDGSTCTNISYSEFVKPTFVSNGCTGCHGTQGGLNLSSHTTLMLGNSNHGPVVIPLNGSGSLLIQKLRGTAPNGVQMPANSGCCLDDGGAPTIDLIEIWIDEGAENN